MRKVSNFVIYAMCRDCMVMYGPFVNDAQRDGFFVSVHSKSCSAREGLSRHVPSDELATRRAVRFGAKAQIETTVDSAGAVAAAPVKVYFKGDCSPAFPSRFPGNCYECGFPYVEGDEIKMVTIRDREKGKAVHADCAEDLIESLLHLPSASDQPDEPPF